LNDGNFYAARRGGTIGLIEQHKVGILRRISSTFHPRRFVVQINVVLLSPTDCRRPLSVRASTEPVHLQVGWRDEVAAILARRELDHFFVAVVGGVHVCSWFSSSA
jgi:hypothetical protein